MEPSNIGEKKYEMLEAKFIENGPNKNQKMNISYEAINEDLRDVIRDWDRLYNSINHPDDKHKTPRFAVKDLGQDKQKNFLVKIHHHKKNLIRDNNEIGLVNQKGKPMNLNGKNYDQLIATFQNLHKFYLAFDESNRPLFLKVFRTNITAILEERKSFNISKENINSQEIRNFINDILDDKVKSITSEDDFKRAIEPLNDRERGMFCKKLLSNLVSPEYNIIFSAIKDSNKISLGTNRTLNDEMLKKTDEKIVEHVKSFFDKLSKSPNSVEAKAWNIYITHSNNIRADNSELLKDIYKSSSEVSLTGPFHSKNKNIIFENAPPNSRRAKIAQSVSELKKVNDEQSNAKGKNFELTSM